MSDPLEGPKGITEYKMIYLQNVPVRFLARAGDQMIFQKYVNEVFFYS